VASSPVQGLAEAHSLFGAIPEAAREQLGAELAAIGSDVLAAQKGDVAKRTGQLEQGLQLKLFLEQLRVRVGLLDLKGGRSRLFYGRIVESGRRARTVLVERRRRVGGRLRTNRGRKVAGDVASTYSLRVQPKAPRPFVHVDRPGLRVEQRLADFWSRVTTAAGRPS
jgi:hypothetical protein